jgi:hypothetical protein
MGKNVYRTIRWRSFCQKAKKAKNMPMGALFEIASERAKNKIKNIIIKMKANLFSTYLSDADFLKAFNGIDNIKDIPAYFRERNQPAFFWKWEDKEKIIKIIKSCYPESIPSTIQEADEICAHIFDLLGSGKKKLGETIDWHVDFKSGHRWIPSHYYKDVREINFKDNSDIKIPWELSRFQHVPILGKAYWYTNDEKYAKEFVDQVTSWINENPPLFGVNWCSTMDVAIRAVNWVWGFYFFRYSHSLTDSFRLDFFKNILIHGRFIYDNLEFDRKFIDGRFRRMNGNHYISNLVGLIYLGVLFPELYEAKQWLTKGLAELLKELEIEIYEDGIQWELSISYHRLVLEMVISAIILCKANDIVIPDFILSRIEKMFDFVANYTKPDGMCPQIRDADNGRLHILSQNDMNDHCYLLAIGAVLFNRSDFKQIATGKDEDVAWLLGPSGHNIFSEIPPNEVSVQSKAFPHSGYYIMRQDNLHMAIIAAQIGMNGYYGGHAHNDFLSFELYAYDKTILTDCGTYVYSASPYWRNKFRSTASHNTVVIDKAEINRFEEQSLFMINNDAVPQLNQLITTDKYDIFDAQHDGYLRLHNPVIHRRQIYFDKEDKYFILRDIVTGTGEHLAELYFHFGAGIDVKINSDSTVETQIEDGANLIILPLLQSNCNYDIYDGWVSPSYGIKKRAKVLKLSIKNETPFTVALMLCPFEKVKPEQLDALKNKAINMINVHEVNSSY